MNKTDVARIWREVYGGTRAEASAFLFADAIAEFVTAELRAELNQTQSDRQREHDLRVRMQSDAESLRAELDALQRAIAAAAEQREYTTSPYDNGWQAALQWVSKAAISGKGGQHDRQDARGVDGAAGEVRRTVGRTCMDA